MCQRPRIIFFYIPQTEIFIQYDNLNYKLISEDDIIHLIIKTITDNEPAIIHWKFRIKTNIIKQIKDTAIHSTIPESETIQTILNHFYPDIFKTKNHIKYFLTILGDNILNKKETLIYLLDPIYKNFIQTITQNSSGHARSIHNERISPRQGDAAAILSRD